MFVFSALLIGFLGSFHCVAMCGPIALAISNTTENNYSYFINRSIYNLGRIITYAILGVIIGLVGKVFLLAGFQKSISIAVGIIMILFVVLINYLPLSKSTGKGSLYLNGLVKKLLSAQIKKRGTLSFLFTGMANGILPCGFVYVALAGAAITQSPATGASYMVMFGLGTFPAMMLVSVLGKYAGFRFRSVIARLSPAFMIILGLFFIYRGLMISEEKPCHGHNTSTKNVSEQVTGF